MQQYWNGTKFWNFWDITCLSIVSHCKVIWSQKQSDFLAHPVSLMMSRDFLNSQKNKLVSNSEFFWEFKKSRLINHHQTDRVGQKISDCFWDQITLQRLTIERHVTFQKFQNFVYNKMHNLHVTEFKYSLPNWHKSSIPQNCIEFDNDARVLLNFYSKYIKTRTIANTYG